MYLGVLNNYKICGKRDGDPFYKAKRPIVDAQDKLNCPEGTVPCDDSVFTEDVPVAKAEVLADKEHPARYLICAETTDQCPITRLQIGYNEVADDLFVSYQKQAIALPIIKVKLSPEQPCLKPSFYPEDGSKFFEDEIRQ